MYVNVFKKYYLTLIERGVLIFLINLNDIDNLDLIDYYWLYKTNLNYFKLLYDSYIGNIILTNNFSGLLYTFSNTIDKKPNLNIDKDNSLE